MPKEIIRDALGTKMEWWRIIPPVLMWEAGILHFSLLSIYGGMDEQYGSKTCCHAL
jgi:hypothetical protein